jgi:hypothetical protein
MFRDEIVIKMPYTLRHVKFRRFHVTLDKKLLTHEKNFYTFVYLSWL